MSSSCNKCVKMLREMISGLQDSESKNNYEKPHHHVSTNTRSRKEESPPLTLLKEIAGSATATTNTRKSSTNQQQPQLQVEDVEDGVRITIPVESTVPTMLRRWTQLPPPPISQPPEEEIEDDVDVGVDTDDILLPLYHAMATSANAKQKTKQLTTSKRSSGGARHPNSDCENNDNVKNSTISADKKQVIVDPLTIELKCRQCASSGPEGGARAFLMGPQPLSVVVCHNRIAGNQAEVEEILTHELVHLFDVQTLQLNLRDCENLAYSEVRAAKAAECRHSWKQLQPYCVKQKAISATNNMFPRQGRNCVSQVFSKAFADHRPFDSSTSNGRFGSTSQYHSHRASAFDNDDDDDDDVNRHLRTSDK